MSTMTSGQVKSNLPEDIEAKLAKAHEVISTIEGKIITVTKELNEKQIALDAINIKISEVTADYEKKVAASEALVVSLNERETKINQRESALNVYANALEEKEGRINKYLAIFENMKDVLS